jgi:hypothetical protein
MSLDLLKHGGFYALTSQGLLWLPKSRSQKNRQVPFSGLENSIFG